MHKISIRIAVFTSIFLLFAGCGLYYNQQPSTASAYRMYLVSDTLEPNTSYHIGSCATDISNGKSSDCIASGAYITASAATTAFYRTSSGTVLAYALNSSASRNIIEICGILPQTHALVNCQDSGVTTPFSIPAGITFHNNFVYITNFGDNTVTFCSVDPATGALSGCAATGSSFSAPGGIAFNDTNSIAYIAEFGTDAITICNVNTNGTLSSCADSGVTFPADSNPFGITIHGGFVYTADNVSPTSPGRITRCAIGSTGALSGCLHSDLGGVAGANLLNPSGIAFDGDIAYIVNDDDYVNQAVPAQSTPRFRITKCSNLDSVFSGSSNCSTAASTYLSGPLGLGIYDGYVYVGNFDDTGALLTEGVSFFKINQTTHDLENASNAGVGFLGSAPDSSGPLGITIGNGHAYISNGGINKITFCGVDKTLGVFTNCAYTTAGSDGSITAFGLANYAGKFLYIAPYLTNTIEICTISQTSGDLTSCKIASNTGTLLNAPANVFVDQNAQFAYIANTNANNIVRCTINPTTGDFSSCSVTGATSLHGPAGIEIYDRNNHQYIYITNSTSNTMTYCSINRSNGVISNCTENSGLDSTLDIPFGASVQPDGNYLFIANSNSNGVTKCKIDGNSGRLSNCADSGVSSLLNSMPQNLVFY